MDFIQEAFACWGKMSLDSDELFDRCKRLAKLLGF